MLIYNGPASLYQVKKIRYRVQKFKISFTFHSILKTPVQL